MVWLRLSCILQQDVACSRVCVCRLRYATAHPTRCKLNTVLNGVALVVNLHTLGQKTLATLGATTGEDGSAILGSHAGAETELALAAALGRLVCSLAHNLISMFSLKSFSVPLSRSGRDMILYFEHMSSPFLLFW